jgi:hypothetical protein
MGVLLYLLVTGTYPFEVSEHVYATPTWYSSSWGFGNGQLWMPVRWVVRRWGTAGDWHVPVRGEHVLKQQVRA